MVRIPSMKGVTSLSWTAGNCTLKDVARNASSEGRVPPKLFSRRARSLTFSLRLMSASSPSARRSQTSASAPLEARTSADVRAESGWIEEKPHFIALPASSSQFPPSVRMSPGVCFGRYSVAAPVAAFITMTAFRFSLPVK